MRFVWAILKRDVKSQWTMSDKGQRKKKISTLVGVVLLGALAVGIGIGSYHLFNFIEKAAGGMLVVRNAIDIAVLNVASLFTVVMVLMSGIQITYRTVYESDDLGFLLAQPVPVSAVFAAKFLSSYSAISATSLLFVLPVWIGFGAALRLKAGFYVLAVASVALLLLFLHSVVSLLLLVAMRYLPGRKMKQLFIAVSAIAGVLIVLMSQIGSAQMATVEDPLAALEALGRGRLVGTWYLPSSWMVSAVLGSLPGFGLHPLPYWSALLAGGVGLALVAIAVSGNYFLAGWGSQSDEIGQSKASKKRRHAESKAGTPFSSRNRTWAVLSKDLRLLWRDPILWYGLAIGVITVGFFVYNTSRTISGGGMADEAAAGALGASVLLISTLMGATVGAQTGGVSLSREGKSVWLLRANPVSGKEVFFAKLAYALVVPSVLFVLATVGVTAIGGPQYPFPWNILLGASMVVAVASLQILLDVFYPDFTLKISFGSTAGGAKGKIFVTMFSSMGLVFALWFALMSPLMLAGGFASTGPSPGLVAASRWIVLLVGLGLASLATTLGVRRLEKTLQDL